MTLSIQGRLRPQQGTARKAHRHALARQAGVTMTETLLVLALAAVLGGVAYRTYSGAREETRLSEMTVGTLTLVSKIDQIFGTSSDFSGLTGDVLADAGVLPSGFVATGEDETITIEDAFGNPFDVAGTTGSYAFAFHGLSPRSCTTLAASLVEVGQMIAVGSSVDVSSGAVVAGEADMIYKAEDGSVSPVDLATGCNQDAPVLGFGLR